MAPRSRRWSQKIVNDDFEWPRLEQIQANTDERQKQADDRFAPERLVIAKDAAINRHSYTRSRVVILSAAKNL
jgi:hypothetical protein